MRKKLIQNLHLSAIAAVVLALLAAVSMLSCTNNEEPDSRLIVAVTILPQAGFVEAIAGDKAEVVVMVPPGASPHTYEVTPDQMTQLSEAKMYARVGSPLEFELTWMDKLIEVNKSMLVVDCSKGIQLFSDEYEHEHEAEHEHGGEDEGEHEHEHQGPDPHIWLSVKNAMTMTQNICDGLVQVDPGHKDYYKKNCAAYLDELSGLDSEFTEDLSKYTNRSFIVFHPAFDYFARDYNLTQIGVEQGGKEPDAEYIVRLINEAKERGIKVVFVSPQYSTRSAESIAKEIGGHVAVINPLAEDFISNMRSVEEAIEKAVQ
ncbi:MAG: zinc ABC transporter substrate-binding protein [Dehalococcoidales bacterium]|nr:zinc ABC transporter substrate-binding protein [Dehalococcoidales bacterium]